MIFALRAIFGAAVVGDFLLAALIIQRMRAARNRGGGSRTVKRYGRRYITVTLCDGVPTAYDSGAFDWRAAPPEGKEGAACGGASDEGRSAK